VSDIDNLFQTYKGYICLKKIHSFASKLYIYMLSDWCCSVSMVWVQIPSREEQTFVSSKI